MYLGAETVNTPSDSPGAFDQEKERYWSPAGMLFGLLLLAAVIFVVKNLGEERRFVELLAKAQPLWLLAGLAYQVTTYFCAAGVWWIVLKKSGVRIPLRSLAPLGLAKLFVDQIIPTAGVGGSVLVVRGLVGRGASNGLATAALLTDLLSFYAAHAIAVGVAILMLWAHQELHPVVLALATVFSIVAVAIPLSILWLTRPGERNSPKWARSIPGVSRLLDRIVEAPAEITRNERIFLQTTILQLAIFALDAATLDAMLRAIGHPTRPDAVFAAFSMAVVAATVSLIPGGLGAFEGTSVLMLRFLNIPIEAGLAATLLLRGFTLWLPMAPGLIISRRENLKRSSAH
jgi:uncharacterized protein (TIRG00374 family)